MARFHDPVEAYLSGKEPLSEAVSYLKETYGPPVEITARPPMFSYRGPNGRYHHKATGHAADLAADLSHELARDVGYRAPGVHVEIHSKNDGTKHHLKR